MVEYTLYLELYLQVMYKKLSCAVIHLLDVGVLALAGAAATRNFNKENRENWRFYSILFESKYVGILLVSYTIILT